ncbi:HET-domain-containing protein [Acephala macrosclerotiorum]|nr:HET-domain-containing protein [Acephala macrosclerotiorum]
MAQLYEPLNDEVREIRLISLLPGDFSDDIYCQLSVVSLDGNPVYEALSYVWGDASQKLPIFLNGEHFNVTKNLESALRHLRCPTITRKLWVDAICINQDNISERSQQVGIMDAIYGKTAEVLIWLGKEQEESDEIFRFDDYQPELPKDMSLDRHPMPFHFDGGIAEKDVIVKLNKKVEQHIGKIMHRAWWYRIWVVQETVLPPKVTVIFGSLIAPWTMFAQAAENFEWHRNRCCKSGFAKLNELDFGILLHFSRTILELETTKKFRARGLTTLLPLIWLTKSRKATDSRDKIFGLLGLVTDWRDQEPIRADYSIISRPIFLEITLKIMQVEKSLSVLAGSLGNGNYPALPKWAASLEPETTTSDYGIDTYRRILRDQHSKILEELPSWIPQFDVPPASNEWDRLRRIQLYNACNNTRPALRLLQDNALSIEGYHIDKIQNIGDVLIRSLDSSRSVVQAWQEMAREHYESLPEQTYPGTRHIHPAATENESPNPCKLACPSHPWHAFFRVICADSLPADKLVPIGSRDRTGGDEYRRMETEDLRRVFAWWRWRWPMNTSTKHQGRDRGNPTDYNPFDGVGSVEDAVWSACMFRRFLITGKGFLGTGPSNIENGDAIFVLKGGSMPFVLRKKDEESWELVGDCFVWGLMDGEGVTGESQTVTLV